MAVQVAVAAVLVLEVIVGVSCGFGTATATARVREAIKVVKVEICMLYSVSNRRQSPSTINQLEQSEDEIYPWYTWANGLLSRAVLVGLCWWAVWGGMLERYRQNAKRSF